jgi:hypothetical protein
VDAFLDCSEQLVYRLEEECRVPRGVGDRLPTGHGSRIHAWRTTNCQLRTIASAIKRSIHRGDLMSLPADMDTHPRLVVGLGYSEGTEYAGASHVIPLKTSLVMGDWQYIGRGHSPGEAIYARTIADDLAENRRALRQVLSTKRKDW